ncbi:MAG TPA: TlpA disulfide reductase family protein, partial [Chitinophagaceae bacterium]
MKARISLSRKVPFYFTMLKLILNLILICATYTSFGQLKVEVLNASHSKLSPVKLGDPVPDIEFPITNLKNPTAKFSDFRGKLVIIDFWGVECTSCIKVLPEIDSLERVYKDRVQFISVCRDS